MLQPKVPSIGGKPSVKIAQGESDSDSSEDEESDSDDDKKPTGKQITKTVRSLEIAWIMKMFYKFWLAWHSSYCCHIACLYPCSLLKIQRKVMGLRKSLRKIQMNLMKRVRKNSPRLQNQKRRL